MIIYKKRDDHTNEIFEIGPKETQVASQVILLEVDIDNKLNFEQQINRICKLAVNQLNALIRLKRFLRLPRKKSPSK